MRVIKVLEQLSNGFSYNLNAENVIRSTGTVRKHIENLYRKLQVDNNQKAKLNKLI